MEFTAQVASALSIGVAIGGGAMRWFKDRQTLRRAAIPNVRVLWKTEDAGHFIRVTVANRMTEDLRIYRVEAKAALGKAGHEYDYGGRVISTTLTPTSKREEIDWRIEAGASGTKEFQIVDPQCRCWLRFTASTSAGTFHRLKFVAEP